MTTQQLEDSFEEDSLGVVYRGSDDYKLESESGRKCTIKKWSIYPVVFLESENEVAIMEIDENNAVAISFHDPDFEFMDTRPLTLPC